MESLPQTSGVYKITCTVNGKVYVGSAINLRRRHSNHFSALRRGDHCNNHLQSSWRKYGAAAFVFEVLEFVLEPFLGAREQYWMNRLRAYTKGFNQRPASDSMAGTVQSPEVIEKRAASLRGRKRDPEIGKKISAAKQGFRFSEESRRKMSEAQRRRTDTARQYVVVAPDGTEMLITNLEQFCRDHGLLRACMYATSIGRTKQHKGWKCRRAD